MPRFRRTTRFVTVTALAASTALTGPLAAYAQEADTPPPQIQDAPPEVPAPEPEAPEAPPAAEPAPEIEEPAAPEPEAEPAPALEPEAPSAPEPEPAPEPASEPAPAAPEPSPEPAPSAAPQAAPDSGPLSNPPVGDPAQLPVDDGTTNDLSDAPASPEPSGASEPAPSEAPAPTPNVQAAPTETAPGGPADEPAAPTDEVPAAPAAPAPSAETPAPPAAPAPGAEPATPATPADPTAPAVPDAPSTAPVNPAAPPTAPDAVPVVPGTPPVPSVLGAPDASAPPPASTAPGAPGTEAAPGASAAPAAVAPPPAETPQPVAADIQTAPVPQGQVGQSDARVQQLTQPIEVQPITAVQGEALQAAPQAVLPPNVEVIERVGDRDILSLVGAGVAGAAVGGLAAYFIRSDDNDRLTRGSRDVRFEQLPRGLTRQTIERNDGSQIVTIENEYGDVIQRSRILPNGEEVVLFYDPYAEDDTRPDYLYDAGADLPPLVLQIPRDRYIVDIPEPDEDLYYDTIVAPPVETVERIYSLNEVRRSTRIRDKVRRIDLNTINFAFGSADIEQGEVENLEALADAVKRVIDDNPGEVFLLEGHTDAVGSNVANLALSDRRAESVASALTDYFEIPAENLVTQGYGEEDLKVDTQSANRENRRVTLRRITALVKPVVSASAR